MSSVAARGVLGPHGASSMASQSFWIPTRTVEYALRPYTMCSLIRLLLVLQALFSSSYIVSSSAAAGPVVAILSQPLRSPPSSASNRNADFHKMLRMYESNVTSANPTESKGMFYIAASYVKWLESVGIRSIVLPYDAPPQLVEDVFNQVNGLLLPGGAAALPESAKHIWKLALRSNEVEGDHFPVWGTCLGFEFLVQLAAVDGVDILQSGFDAENVSLPLHFVDDGYGYELYEATSMLRRETSQSTDTSSLFPGGSRVREIAARQNVTLNNHRNGIEPKRFLSDTGLTSMFHIVSTNNDGNGRPFVSTIEPLEPNRHPYYGVQFHPEKNMFENAFYPSTIIPYEDINHSPDGIELSFHLAKFFGGLVRRNMEESNVDAADGVRRTKRKHEYTDPIRHPLITTYPTISGVAFEQIHIVPQEDAHP